LTPLWHDHPPDIIGIINSPGIVLSDLSMGVPQLGFVYAQNTPSDTWTISHNLTFHPNVTVVDSGGSVVEGEISYPTPTTVLLTFRSGFSGKAYLS
jgi:hypothetical protein